MAGLPACTRPWRGGRRPRGLVEVCGCLGLLAVACSWSLRALARATSASDCFLPALRWPSLDARRLGPGRGRGSLLQLRATKLQDGTQVLFNQEIRAQEVRLVFEKSPINPGESLDQIMLTRDAIRRARELGLDVIQVEEDDPPRVWIMKKSIYLKEMRVSAKALQKSAKAPKRKEVKLSYAIGEHDLNVHCKRMENWFKDQDPRQQVQVKMIMKGRMKAFGSQAKDVLNTLRRETAAFCQAQLTGRGDQVIMVEKSGDMTMMMNAGPDMELLKEMRREAEEELVASMEDAVEEKAAKKEKHESEADKALKDNPVAKEIAQVEKEMEEMKQELLECGVPPGQVYGEEEMRYLSSKLRQLQDKLEATLAGGVKK